MVDKNRPAHFCAGRVSQGSNARSLKRVPLVSHLRVESAVTVRTISLNTDSHRISKEDIHLIPSNGKLFPAFAPRDTMLIKQRLSC